MMHIITPEYLPQVGGVAAYTRGVARALAAAGEEVHVWGPGTARHVPGDGFTLHPNLGAFGASDLRRAAGLLDGFPAPRRLLVQWVPHGYGYRALNVKFCLWLWDRARRGDRVELMVHEAFLAMWEGSWRQTAAALVHRLMTMVLLQSAVRVWTAIPAWEMKWKPYSLGKSVRFEWLPVPCNLEQPAPERIGAARAAAGAHGSALVGHFGTYGPLIEPLLEPVLLELLAHTREIHVLLVGAGSDAFRARLVAAHPDLARAVSATGALPDDELPAHIAACDLLVQPYPDGISSRRTTAMAALSLGVPMVTTRGHLTEGMWHDSHSVRLTAVGDARSMAAEARDLLAHPEARRRLARAGRELYGRVFDVRHTVAALTRQRQEAAA